MRDILSIYDSSAQGKNDFKNLMEYFGVTRAEVAAMKLEKTCSKDYTIISFGRQHIFSSGEGELTHQIPTQQGVSTFYSTPLYLHDRFNGGSFCAESFVGNSAKIGWFSVMKKCGNFQIKKDVRRLPKANFLSANCKTIQGFAYDERQSSQPVKVYLFFGGPPGKGKTYGPITADQSTPNSPAGTGHGFNFAVPEQYQADNQSTEVWGIMQPLSGWTETSVQIPNTVTISGDCAPQATPIAECTSLIVNLIDRAKVRLATTARADNGARIEAYTYTITDSKGKIVFNSSYNSDKVSFTTDIINLGEGTYTAKSTIKSSVTSLDAPQCTKPLTVANVHQCRFNAALDSSDKDCQPCPHNAALWLKDENCVSPIAQSKVAKNLTQANKDAETTLAKPGDRIEYTLHTTNVGLTTTATSIEENLADVLEYGILFENGGGSMNLTNKVLKWDKITLQPGQVDTRRIIVQVSDKIPATPRAGNNPSSYNCIMTNSYGNTTNIKIDCPPEKLVEATIQQLPSTGSGGNIIFAGGLFMTVTYFYARSRQMNKEVRLLRKQFDGGTV